MKVAHIFRPLRTLRAEGSARFNETPLVSMVSYAIIHRLGVERFLNEAATAGPGRSDRPRPARRGISGSDREQATAHGLKLIQLITPTTPRDRAIEIARSTTGFIYYVSVAGITGERKSLPDDLVENVAWLRTQTDLPICIGFRHQRSGPGPPARPGRRRPDRRQRDRAPLGRGESTGRVARSFTRSVSSSPGWPEVLAKRRRPSA